MRRSFQAAQHLRTELTEVLSGLPKVLAQICDQSREINLISVFHLHGLCAALVTFNQCKSIVFQRNIILPLPLVPHSFI